MALRIQALTAALYLLASLLAGFALALPSARAERFAIRALWTAALLHLASFALLHRLDPPPPLTHLPVAVSFMACIGTLFFLVLLRRVRMAALAVLVAPIAFLSSVFALRIAPSSAGASELALSSASWSHAHVLLASAGLACLGLSAIAGLIFLLEHRRIKTKHPLGARWRLPSLEALDRANRASLVLGFPLLSLGVASGALWLVRERGTPWSGAPHEVASLLAWGIYALLVGIRFGSQQAARPAALSAVAGFVFLCLAVIGLEVLA